MYIEWINAWILQSSVRTDQPSVPRWFLDLCLARYAILEIKLQDVSEAPLWLRQTLNDIGAKLACLVDVFGGWQIGKLRNIVTLRLCAQCISSVAVLGMKSD